MERPAPALLGIHNLHVHFPRRARRTAEAHGMHRVVDGVSLEVARGELLGVIGESGCGKSTLARAVLQLAPVTSGDLFFEGRNLRTLSRRERCEVQRRMQIVFQDPMSSLNPRMRVADIVAEPMMIHRVGTSRERRKRAAAMLARVGLSATHLDRYPHEFSGGQRQRIGIARALILDPTLVIFDEPISALDVTTAMHVLDLIRELKRTLRLTGLFIAHQLGAVRNLCERVAVMHRGRVVEQGAVEEVYADPRHPYTRTLLASAGWDLFPRQPCE